jgi:imidazolonepropionase-like amidohydrolase
MRERRRRSLCAGGIFLKLWAGVCLAAINAAAASYHFAAVWDGTKLWKDACITVEGERIIAVGACSGASVDLTRYTAIPGMVDVHTHMTYIVTNRVSRAGRTAAVPFLAQDNARKTLEAGVTTVRDLGAAGYTDITMRDLINQGLMVGPRMFVAGYGLSQRRDRPAGPNLAHGPEEVEKIVKEQVTAGADVIKMYGSTGSGKDVSGTETFSFEEMKAACDAAHAAGKRIAIHSYGPAGARDAIRAGTDSLEHATDMDDETIAELARKQIFYVPTIDHNRYYADNAQLLKYNEQDVAGLKDYIARNLETAKKAVKAGVKFAMGSDAVYTMFGENTRELEWFVKAGMSPEQALRAATKNGAELLQQPDIGGLRPGAFADIAAVEGDPLADIQAATRRVRWVMKNGMVVVEAK